MSKRILIFIIVALLALSAAGCATVKQAPADSQAATPSPDTAVTAAPSASGSVNGVSSETGYVNDALGFSMAYPQGYTVLIADEIDSLMAQTIDYIKSKFSDPALADKALSQSIPVAMAFKHALTYKDGFNANFNVLIMDIPGAASEDILNIASSAVEQAQSQIASITYSDPKAIEIDGKAAAVVDASQTAAGYSVIQKQYFFASGDHVVALTIAADSDADLGELAGMAESIQFAK